MSSSVPSMRKVGILGGGQLARMLALAGIPLGLQFRFLDPAADACAAELGDLLQAGFDDAQAAAALGQSVDVATYDFENVPAATASALLQQCPLYPGVTALQQCQDRLTEKTLLQDLGIAVPPFMAVNTRPDLLAAVEKLGFPCVLKTRRLGYDGKGQAILRQPEDLERAWQRLGGHELILEAFVAFDAECSLIAVRSQAGEIRAWPLTRNVHADGVLVLSQPGSMGTELQQQAELISRKLLEHFDYVGVMTVEFFLANGQLLVNEIAPRVHNSGHWTINAASTSQFENHLRAICALPLGSTAQLRPCLMFNWLGQLPDPGQLLTAAELHWHDYGKVARAGRKLGHATLTAATEKELQQASTALAEQLGGRWPDLLCQVWN
ncbi:MAG TPA: 5-(carboxyamino)imidazole ribonucleotide synthase [Xanthomonadales bacterium]|nr:5-(carboxyamino)imidazole ribonucleotide synthase [Xanthomonadales bacterium]